MNIKLVATKSIPITFMMGAAAISFSHIIDVSHTLGLGWEAWTVPFMLDGVAVLGLIGRSSSFSDGTRRAGLLLVVGAGLLSLVCNVMAGDNLGKRLYGALVVVVFLACEWYAKKITAAPAPKPEVDVKRRAAALKGAETRRRNKAAAAKATRKPRAPKAAKISAGELAEIEAGYALADAPVSPAA